MSRNGRDNGVTGIGPKIDEGVMRESEEAGHCGGGAAGSVDNLVQDMRSLEYLWSIQQ